ncbi:hypothetical protein Ct61P_15234 [Colletotrichum tofieldiae]|nr:hypothetical protein Ct61P_15234 [Colletotrichum tofieldiae]
MLGLVGLEAADAEAPSEGRDDPGDVGRGAAHVEIRSVGCSCETVWPGLEIGWDRGRIRASLSSLRAACHLSPDRRGRHPNQASGLM